MRVIRNDCRKYVKISGAFLPVALAGPPAHSKLGGGYPATIGPRNRVCVSNL